MSTEKTDKQIISIREGNLLTGQPDYIKRFSGIVLTFVSTIGLLLTSPLLFLGGVVGLFTSFFSGTDPLESGLKGAKIGALGSINGVSLGIELTKATVAIEEINQQELSLLETTSKELEAPVNQETITDILTEEPESEKLEATTNQEILIDTPPNDSPDKTPVLKASTLPSTFFSKNKLQTPLETSQTVESECTDVSEKFKDFIIKVNASITRDEAQAEPQKEENQPSVTEQNIVDLIEVIKNRTLSEHHFWNKLDQMSHSDIKLLVSKFNSTKEKRKNSLSELDHLWNYFKGVEYEPSKVENRKNKFAVILTALSEIQLKTSFDSASFLSILSKDAYVDTAANTLNREQLALFASNRKHHEMLNAMIKKLKPTPYLLGKLISIIPYASDQVRTALMEQINYLKNEDYPVSFKKVLRELAQHYILSNHEAERKRLAAIQPTTITKSQSLPAKKWAPVHTAAQPVHNTTPVQKQDWTDEEFDAFIHDLNAADYYINEQKIHENLASLPDDRVRMLVERSSSPDGKDLLKNLWVIESKTLNSKSRLDSRENRLKIVLEHLSESQLKSSVTENKFWEIFRNTQESFCKMAAQVLTPQQFAIIIANAPLERHEDFAILINQINKDSPAEKTRLQEVIAAIIPYTTPWFALTLERQIKSVLPQDKSLFERFTTDFRKELSESLQRSEINLKYARDTKLNKKVISRLTDSIQEPSSSPSFSF